MMKRQNKLQVGQQNKPQIPKPAPTHQDSTCTPRSPASCRPRTARSATSSSLRPSLPSSCSWASRWPPSPTRVKGKDQTGWPLMISEPSSCESLREGQGDDRPSLRPSNFGVRTTLSHKHAPHCTLTGLPYQSITVSPSTP